MATPIPTTLPPGVVGIRVSPQIPPYMPAGTEWWIVTDLRGGQSGMTPAQYQAAVAAGYFAPQPDEWARYQAGQPAAPALNFPGGTTPTLTEEDWANAATTLGPSSEGYLQQRAAWSGAGGGTPGAGETLPPVTTAAGKAAQMLYSAMRGLPFISTDFLASLISGQPPAPRTVTPQTLAALSADSTLSDAFFSVIRGNALYPESYLAEIGRYIPRGREATPSFI